MIMFLQPDNFVFLNVNIVDESTNDCNYIYLTHTISGVFEWKQGKQINYVRVVISKGSSAHPQLTSEQQSSYHIATIPAEPTDYCQWYSFFVPYIGTITHIVQH